MVENLRKKVKQWWETQEHELFLFAVVVLVSVIVIGGARLWFFKSYEVQPRKIVIEENAFVVSPKQARLPDGQGLGQAPLAGGFVASINGAKYYPANCKAANRINQENRIWFTSVEEAEAMGYERTSQC